MPFEGQKETNCLLFVGKGITDIPLQADQVVCCASVLSEATLAPVEDSLLLQVPDQALIDHSFQDFAQAASECYGSITQWVRVWGHIEYAEATQCLQGA